MTTDASLAHLGYVVRNMDRSITRFTNEGAELVIEPKADPLQKVVCALLRVDGAVDIELVAPIAEGDSPVDSRLARGGGLDHVCYHVPDVAEALARDVVGGSVVVCEPVYACVFDRQIAFVQRRSGLIVEFMSAEPA